MKLGTISWWIGIPLMLLAIHLRNGELAGYGLGGLSIFFLVSLIAFSRGAKDAFLGFLIFFAGIIASLALMFWLL